MSDRVVPSGPELFADIKTQSHKTSMQATIHATSAPPNPPPNRYHSARNGALLSMANAASLGMPLEVWKTHLGRHRHERTFEGLRNIYVNNGRGLKGVGSFWRGTSAKMAESASKGAVLMFSKELLKDGCTFVGLSPAMSGFIAGFGGGVCQVSVMGPCTYLITASVIGNTSMLQQIKSTWSSQGLRGFYPGGMALAFRQATNWASRQGFTDAIREVMRGRNAQELEDGVEGQVVQLSVRQEICAGILGGTLSSWNHPFEVCRIEAQARAVAGQPPQSMFQIMRSVVAQHGVGGLFKGVFPRVLLSVWQTSFMVTGAHLIREHWTQ
eukprot:m.21199 g.21199  ORF g.21199 m.21199 type:complete len:326 (+) comp8255_c0_seq2:573-1550(+)